MTAKIFRCMFGVGLSVLLLFSILIFALLFQYFGRATIYALTLSLLRPLLLIILLAVILSAFLSARLAKRIIRPILTLDPEHPEEAAAVYPELTPLISRIRHQNTTITQQMEQLRQKQTEFIAITQNMSEGFLLIDPHGYLLTYNTAALTLLQAAPPEDRTGYLTLCNDPIFHQAVKSALNGCQGHHLLRSGDRVCQLLSSPVLEDTHICGAVVVVLDVTEREERDSLRREFTANVSHELRTPLTSISGIAEILKNGLVQPNDIPEFAGDIYNEAQRLIHLVGDIIRLSQLDEGGPALERQRIDLRALSHAVSKRLTAAANHSKIKLEVTGTPEFYCGVPAILDEMVYNLCDNAIKYNRPGGVVTLHTCQTQRGIELLVRDTGIGIPAESIPRVFERFYRVDKSHSKAIGGTGLGLSIVKHGAAFHGAQVELESQLGQGTSIRLIFPPEAPDSSASASL